MAGDELLEGWMEIGQCLGLKAPSKEALRKKLRGWLERAGLPVRRIGQRVYARPKDLRRWWRQHKRDDE